MPRTAIGGPCRYLNVASSVALPVFPPIGSVCWHSLRLGRHAQTFPVPAGPQPIPVREVRPTEGGTGGGMTAGQGTWVARQTAFHPSLRFLPQSIPHASLSLNRSHARHRS